MSRATEKVSGWDEVSLDQIFDFKKGQGLSKEKLTPDGKTPCLLYGELYTTYSEVIREVRSRTDAHEGIPSVAGDILIPASTTTSALDVATAAAIEQEGVLLGGDINILRKKAGKKIDSRYFAYLLTNQEKRNLARFAQGSTITHLYGRHIKNLSVVIPSELQEQRAIAAVLIQVEDALLQTEAMILKYEKVKQGMVQDLLQNGLDEAGKIRNQSTHGYKKSPIGGIPNEWTFCKLGEFLDENGGYVQTGPFGSQLHSYEYVQEGIPVVMPQDIERGKIILDKIARITPKKAKALERHQVKENDVIFARRGELNRGVAITANETGWLCGTGCLLFRPNAKTLSAEWFSLIYSSPLVQRQLEAIAVGSTMKNINTGVIHALNIAIPSLLEQKRITQVIDSITRLINRERARRNKLLLERAGLASDLLVGKVRTKVP